MKKILVITYYWPPSGGSGVQRWAYFCKYLPEFGIEPIVLTVDEKKASYKSTDTEFLEMVKDVETYKTNTFEPLKLYSLLTTGSSNKGIPQGHVGDDKKSLFNKVSTYIRGNYFIPDARVGWNRFAFKQAKKIIESENIDLIVTTGPPNSTHLVGLKLKKLLNIKWIADFRDPWTDLFYVKDLMRTNSSQKKDAIYEKSVLNNADIILTVGSKLKELLYTKINSREDNFRYIYNGYDSVKIDNINPDKHSHFEMTYTGLLSKNSPYQSLIESLKIFIGKNPKCNVKFRIAGNIDNKILSDFRNELPEIQIDYLGYVKHNKALELMKSSQLLINCLPEMKDSQILVSGKLMEYVSTGNPILFYGNKNGESALVLEKLEYADTFEKEEIEKAANFIDSIYKNWESGNTLFNNIESKEIKDKSRINTAKKLSELIKEL